MNILDKIDNGTAKLSDQEEALKASWSAYEFARLNIPGTDIEKCQEAACLNPWCAYYFAKDIPGADVEYCRKACESNPELLKNFDIMIVEKVLRVLA